jgi:hypothetical protein
MMTDTDSSIAMLALILLHLNFIQDSRRIQFRLNAFFAGLILIADPFSELDAYST